MADRFPFMRVYKDMASRLSKEDRADFYDALIDYALDEEEPEPSVGAAVFEAARRMVDKWKQTSAAGKARAEKTAGRSLDGRWEVAGSENPAEWQKSKNAGSENPAKEEKKKRINNIKDNKESMSLTGHKKETGTALETDPSEMMRYYNNICIDMPRATKMTDARRQHIRARLREYSAEDICQVFTKAQESDFLTGRKATDRNWRADFDWIIGSAEHMQKIIEGAYDNKQPRDPAGNVARMFIGSASPEAVRRFEETMNGGRG